MEFYQCGSEFLSVPCRGEYPQSTATNASIHRRIRTGGNRGASFPINWRIFAYAHARAAHRNRGNLSVVDWRCDFRLKAATALTTGRRIVLCVGNSASTGAKVRGNGGAKPGRALVSTLGAIASHFRPLFGLNKVVPTRTSPTDLRASALPSTTRPSSARRISAPLVVCAIFSSPGIVGHFQYRYTDGNAGFTSVRPCQMSVTAESQ